MKRLKEIDGLKYFLILLIILLHTFEPFLQISWVRACYMMLYGAAVPGLAFVAGYCSRDLSLNKWLRTLPSILVPLLIFQFVFVVLSLTTAGPLSAIDWSDLLLNSILKPQHALWFLLSLVFWRLLYALFRFNASPLILITISFVLIGAISLKHFDHQILAIGKTVYFFPFFLIGAYTTERTWKSAWKGSTNVYLLLVLNLVFFIPDIYEYPDVALIVDGSASLTHLDGDLDVNLVLRLMFLIVSLANIRVFLRLSKGLAKYYKEGANVATYYLFHALFLVLALNSLNGMGVTISVAFIPILFFANVIFCFILSKFHIGRYVIYPCRMLTQGNTGNEQLESLYKSSRKRKRKS